MTGGANLADAYGVTEEIEFCCELYYRSKTLGDPVILPRDEMERMIVRFQNYGKRIEEHDEI